MAWALFSGKGISWNKWVNLSSQLANIETENYSQSHYCFTWWQRIILVSVLNYHVEMIVFLCSGSAILNWFWATLMVKTQHSESKISMLISAQVLLCKQGHDAPWIYYFIQEDKWIFVTSFILLYYMTYKTLHSYIPQDLKYVFLITLLIFAYSKLLFSFQGLGFCWHMVAYLCLTKQCHFLIWYLPPLLKPFQYPSNAALSLGFIIPLVASPSHMQNAPYGYISRCQQHT